MRYATIENNSGKKFTWEELAKHNKPDDAYVAVRGNVYDITNFIERHPGGDDILLLAAGRDITQAFETYHELGKPDVVLKKFFVGTLVTNELPIFPEPSEFHRAMKKNVEEYFRKTEIDPKHAFGHHIYTNIAGCDPDLVTNDPDIRRIKPSQRWYSRYVNQHLFVPILYGFLAIKVRIQDIPILYFVGSNDKIRINPITTWHTCVFWSGKVFFVLHRIIIPLMISFSAWKVFLLFAIADAVSSYWLALTFQANHVVGEVEWPLPDKDGLIQKDWAEMQIITTQDYAHDSRFITSIVGSLNYQAVHHVFPQVSQHHYHMIGPIVKETCREFGNTLWEAIGSHIRHLRFLGLKPEDHSKTE
ncbi:4596_t:CDS:10 [Cetraspora pellucida]|uniref:4596_t:CDS:1 n=1 Tax=Cetraspora pellucida TaxID=1433469 RepID=A0A9N9CXW2_9GLOM|nr:4596_t:CDS:10 [Cetraspora pellucida]